MRTTSTRAMVAIAGAAALTAPLALVAHATVVQPSTARGGSLVQVGPIAANGFPSWYRDSTGLRLEPCWQTGDPLCEPLHAEGVVECRLLEAPGNIVGERRQRHRRNAAGDERPLLAEREREAEIQELAHRRVPERLRAGLLEHANRRGTHQCCRG